MTETSETVLFFSQKWKFYKKISPTKVEDFQMSLLDRKQTWQTVFTENNFWSFSETLSVYICIKKFKMLWSYKKKVLKFEEDWDQL